jgi:hypothetical protein
MACTVRGTGSVFKQIADKLYVILRGEKHGLSLFERRVPRRIFGLKEEVDEVYGKTAYRGASWIGFFAKHCLYDHMW